MSYLLDTNVLIHLRDGRPEILDRITSLDRGQVISIISRVELEGGILRSEVDMALRRRRLDMILEEYPVLDFDAPSALAYRHIIESIGYSRRKLLDRMIAAQAIVHRATLVTCNANDFQDIPELDLLAI